MQIKIHKTPSGTVRYPHHRHRNYEIMHYIRGRGKMWTEKGEQGAELLLLAETFGEDDNLYVWSTA
jgi:mannose-6-phosphate isomerase-like protein (cupin superfamily)